VLDQSCKLSINTYMLIFPYFSLFYRYKSPRNELDLVSRPIDDLIAICFWFLKMHTNYLPWENDNLESDMELRKIIYEKKSMALKEDTREAFLKQFDTSLRDKGRDTLGPKTLKNIKEIFELISTQGNVYLFILIYPYCSLCFLIYPYNF